LLTWLASETVGYCGADLKALCSEAALKAFKRRYPQVYSSSRKLLIDPNQVKVSE
jgi:SpoVK/Ycf46/Vps4 family AAA+-type ATPase